MTQSEHQALIISVNLAELGREVEKRVFAVLDESVSCLPITVHRIAESRL